MKKDDKVIKYTYMWEEPVRMWKGKKSGTFTLYTFGLIDHLHFLPFKKVTMCFMHLEESIIMQTVSERFLMKCLAIFFRQKNINQK